jgi:hypothetical protein
MTGSSSISDDYSAERDIDLFLKPEGKSLFIDLFIYYLIIWYKITISSKKQKHQ